MVVDSNNKDIPTQGDQGFAGDYPARIPQVLSVSRRVKIGVVLLLMMGGYFLIDDRPRPDSTGASVADTSGASLEMQEFFDELTLVDEGNIRSEPSRRADSESLREPLTSSVAGDSFPQPRADTTENSRTTVASHQQVRQLRNDVMHHSSRNAVRPRLRFTGRIEPLR